MKAFPLVASLLGLFLVLSEEEEEEENKEEEELETKIRTNDVNQTHKKK